MPWPNDPVWSLPALLAAPLAGLFVAWLSYQAPRWVPGDEPPPPETQMRRVLRWVGLPLASLGTAIWAVALFGVGPAVLITSALGWMLLLIATVDGEHFWLPDGLTLPLLAAGLASTAWLAPELLISRVIGAVAGFASLAGIAWLYSRLRGREGLGGGDPRLFAAAGAWVGWQGLPSVMVWATAAGFSVILARLIVRRRVAATDRLAFGVFLAIGLWMVWCFGPIGL